jgi:hypothetical protein
MPEEDPTTREMRLEQIQKEREEHARAETADEDAEERAHARRAERAQYLRDKLEQRAEAERKR